LDAVRHDAIAKLVQSMWSSAKLTARRPVASRIALYGLLLLAVAAFLVFLPRTPAPVFDTAWSKVDYEADEDVRRLQALVRIDTTSDVGREIDAARYLAGILESAGLPVEIEEHPGAKANLWAILEGEAEEALVLHNHLDVDPIRRPDDWVVPPFEGRIDPPWIVGRGVFDMKSVTIAQLAAVLAAKERMDETGRRPRRSLIFLATSSEETGSGPGTRHILANRPELARRFWAVLTEGGVLEAPWAGEVKYWGTSFAQKQFLEVTARSPSAERLEQLRAALHLARRAAPPTVLVPEVEAFAAAYGPSRHHPDYRAALAEPERVLSEPELFRRLPDLLKALFRNEAHPFAVEKSASGGYSLRIVLHVLPGLDADAAAVELLPSRLLDGIDIQLHERRGAARGSPLDHPAYVQLIDSLIRRTGVEPARVGPYLLTRYANDARFFRRHGVVAYGFTPFMLLSVDTMTVAGPNEKIALPAFVEGVELYRQVVFDLLDLAAAPDDSSETGLYSRGASG
jgi:acetylornithine deacetylase/succinyl-diaminopimelate desuccinylase-like protein